MWRWIQNQSRGRCEVLSAPASDRHSLLAYVGDVRPQLFGDGERGGTRGSLRQDDLLGESAFGTLQTLMQMLSMSALRGKADIPIHALWCQLMTPSGQLASRVDDACSPFWRG